MDAKTQAIEINRARFEREFGVIGKKIRESWFTLYLELLEGGDDHLTAVETVRGEMQYSKK